MMKTLGAAVGAVLVLLFLVSVASRLTWSAPDDDPAPVKAARVRR
jgi:hypothetical protein